MCNTTGPKMFFQPGELGSQGSDMATVHASNPQATFDAGDPTNFPAPPQPPPQPPPTPPTPTYGGGGGGFGNSPLFRSPFDPANRGRMGGMGGPRINWREGEGAASDVSDNVDLSTLRWGAGAPTWPGRPGMSPTSPTAAPTAPPSMPTAPKIPMPGYMPFSSMLPSPARSGVSTMFRRPGFGIGG